MTNGEKYYLLNEKERKEIMKTYNNHPLAEYIDWKSFWRSEDGNEMHFVNSIRIDKGSDNNDIYVLKRLVKDGEDYELVYTDEEFQIVPVKG